MEEREVEEEGVCCVFNKHTFEAGSDSQFTELLTDFTVPPHYGPDRTVHSLDTSCADICLTVQDMRLQIVMYVIASWGCCIRGGEEVEKYLCVYVCASAVVCGGGITCGVSHNRIREGNSLFDFSCPG